MVTLPALPEAPSAGELLKRYPVVEIARAFRDGTAEICRLMRAIGAQAAALRAAFRAGQEKDEHLSEYTFAVDFYHDGQRYDHADGAKIAKQMQRDAKVTFLATAWMDWIEGHSLQLTNADKSRTFASIYMHENKLYIMEGTVPQGAPEPALFQQSLGWIDEKGDGVRYQSIYRNGFPPPPRANR